MSLLLSQEFDDGLNKSGQETFQNQVEFLLLMEKIFQNQNLSEVFENLEGLKNNFLEKKRRSLFDSLVFNSKIFREKKRMWNV